MWIITEKSKLLVELSNILFWGTEWKNGMYVLTIPRTKMFVLWLYWVKTENWEVYCQHTYRYFVKYHLSLNIN